MEDAIKNISHFIITVFAVLILLNIWWAYYNNRLKNTVDKNENKDYGVLLLALALSIWAFISLYVFFQKNSPEKHNIFINFLSILNDGLFLCSITYFEHGIEKLKELKNQRRIFLYIFLMSMIFCIAVLMVASLGNTIIPDFIELGYSIITLTILMGVLFLSFFHRKLYIIAFISLIVVTTVIFGQIFVVLESNKMISNGEGMKNLIQIVFISSYSLLSTIFISLSFSWIIEKVGGDLLKEIEEANYIDSALNKYTEPKQLIIFLKESLSKSQPKVTERVLDIITKWFEKNKRVENIDDSYLLKGRLNSLKRKQMLGIISDEDLNKSEAKLSVDITSLINEIK